MSEFPYEVGDTFEGGPIYLQRYIGEILAVGGEFDYDGNVVTLTYLPWDYTKEVKAEVALEPVVEEAPVAEPVVEEASVVEPVKEAPVAEPVVEEAPTPKAPVQRGRKPKVVEPTE